MSYRYRCQQCRTTSPLLSSRSEAEAEGCRHRAAFHDGHVPDGERLLRYGPADNEWWTGRHAAWVAAGVLAVIGWIKGYRL
jgi:hypothetical protein